MSHADRHAHRDARHAQAERLQEPREIERRRLALDGGIGREDDLLDAARRPTRASRPLIFSSSGPMPWSGAIAPISTW